MVIYGHLKCSLRLIYLYTLSLLAQRLFTAGLSSDSVTWILFIIKSLSSKIIFGGHPARQNTCFITKLQGPSEYLELPDESLWNLLKNQTARYNHSFSGMLLILCASWTFPTCCSSATSHPIISPNPWQSIGTIVHKTFFYDSVVMFAFKSFEGFFFPDANKVKTRQIPWSSNIRTWSEASSGAVTWLYTWRHYTWPIYRKYIFFLFNSELQPCDTTFTTFVKDSRLARCVSATVSRLVRLLPSRFFRSLWRETQWQWWDANRLEGWYIGMKQIGSWIGNVSVRERMFVYSSWPSSSIFWFWY